MNANRMYSQAIEEYRVESQISGDRDESDYVSAMENGFRSGAGRVLSPEALTC
jgi:hypothetical protein